jgi:hypothetical protein
LEVKFSDVKTKTSSTWIHNHKKAFSTLSHAKCVEKITYPTPKQALKHVAALKRSLLLKLSCGKLKLATPT